MGSKSQVDLILLLTILMKSSELSVANLPEISFNMKKEHLI